ncbi:MAG TPA: ATP-grasp domain-containing protein [Polyangiaceae bacterium]|nr:ATP-grasp domain-containing protein [Polyangiaceae bacterium]
MIESSRQAPHALILSLSNWFGAARLPRALQRAGFRVTTLSFPGLLIQRAGFINEALLLDDALPTEALIESVLQALDRASPDIVIPTDDASVVVLQAAAAVARQGSGSDRLSSLLDDSLGDSRHHATVRSRKPLAALAAKLGLNAPRHAVVHDERQAVDFAATHGYPVVLKTEESFAGLGVSICKDEAELKAALLRLAGAPGAPLAQGVLAQAFVAGRTAMRVVVAWRGQVLGGLSAIKLETWPGSTGPSCVVELIEHPQMQATAQRLIEALGFSGFASLDFILGGQGGAELIELNPRPTPISHLGERFGSCLFRPLHGALTGTPSPAPAPLGLPSKVALFPQEWVRNADSPHFVDGFHDVPWDQPDLVDAYVTLARGQMRFSWFRSVHARQEEARALLGRLERSGHA